MPKETAAPIEQQSKGPKIDQAKERLDVLLKFVMERSNIHSGARLLILQAKKLVAQKTVNSFDGGCRTVRGDALEAASDRLSEGYLRTCEHL